MTSHPTVEIQRLLPNELLSALAAEAAGHPLHVVGGAVRDLLLDRPAPDLDLVTAGGGAALGRRLADHLEGRFVDLGQERFASYRIVAGPWTVDLWDRGAATLEADLARRDLTINSIAVALPSGRMSDPFDGVADLDHRLLRATTRESFTGDPLRVVRLARFAASLNGFRPVSDTIELAREAANGLERVAAERIREEIDRLLASHGRAAGVGLLADLGLYPRLWVGPEPSPELRLEPLLQHLEALGPMAAELTAVTGEAAPEIDLVTVSQAFLFQALGDAGPGAAGTSTLLTRRRRRRVDELLDVEELPSSPAADRWFLHRWGAAWPEAVLLATPTDPDRNGSRLEPTAHRLAKLAQERGAEIFAPPKLLDGDEVARLLEIEAGPTVGAALEALTRAQLEGRVGSRAEARDFLLRWRAG